MKIIFPRQVILKIEPKSYLSFLELSAVSSTDGISVFCSLSTFLLLFFVFTFLLPFFFSFILLFFFPPFFPFVLIFFLLLSFFLFCLFFSFSSLPQIDWKNYKIAFLQVCFILQQQPDHVGKSCLVVGAVTHCYSNVVGT